MSAVPALYIPQQTPRDVARRLILRRWLATAGELLALVIFVAMVWIWSALGAGA
ncbi:hypothetical protein [Bosea lathyri]|uniref:Uncharacterized protein n=1 Tax=Bosea lathyri TaxID=1036778 RepID=A0A1H6BDP9_9HYPH|nr:hypothetical protein [Bosea lathyri]SEG58909.1 hypothetical protein SAMN04488115_107162 [Bosea lathyri]